MSPVFIAKDKMIARSSAIKKGYSHEQRPLQQDVDIEQPGSSENRCPGDKRGG